MNEKKVKLFQEKLLNWYDIHARDLPWRAKKGDVSNPYYVWLSEIMLQQTTIATVKDYFFKFINTWPTLDQFSKASEDDILTAWAGLGYYSRARNLKKTANILAHEYGHIIPDSYEELIKLPGIGDYTASAIRAIAYNKDAVVMDGNVERVVSRIFMIEDKLPKAKPAYKEKTTLLSCEPYGRYGDFAQAMMDLGSTICTVTSPKCSLCPVSSLCQAHKKGDTDSYPRKETKKKKPKRYTNAFFIQNEAGQFFIRKRPEKGLLANMYEIPSSSWIEKKNDNQLDVEIPFIAKTLSWKKKKGVVKHVFTHFELFVTVFISSEFVSKDSFEQEGVFVSEDILGEYALPTLMKKIISHAQM